MFTAFFENTFFLQALGWAIANSFWQVGLLLLLYKVITGLKLNSTSIFKHNLSFALLMLSSVWFVCTIIQTYQGLNNSPASLFSFAIDPSLLSTMNGALPFLAVIYVLFLIFYLLRFTGSIFKTTQLKTTNLFKPHIDIKIFVNNTALHMGINKKVQVWLTENVDVPSVIGFFKPVILLPVASITRLNTQQVEAILLHELAHIKRQDFLLNVLQTIAKLILFFNPFANLLYKQITDERENCCDDWVINYQFNKEIYANALLEIETFRQEKVILALTATNGKKQLLKRIKRLFITEPATFLNGFQKIQLITISMIVAFTIILIAPIKIAQHNNIITAEKFVQDKNIQPIAVVEKNDQATEQPSVKLKQVEKRKTIVAKANTIRKNNDYSIALINEELLQLKEPKEYKIISVSEEDKIDDPIYFIKVEEERSGAKNNSVYYFQLSSDSGKANVKPIIFLNQPVKKVTPKKLPDTTVVPGKRVTT